MKRKRVNNGNKKEWFLLIGGLFICFVCIIIVGVLLYLSMILNRQIPEYALAFFTSITTLILGYIFGRAFKK